MSPEALNSAILTAHAESDGTTLAQLYGQAGDGEEAAGNVDAACFFWVQSLVFALEAGADAARPQQKLVRYGREAEG